MVLILTDQQKKIIEHFNGHALIIAGPGSGKTTTLIEHVGELILSKNIPTDDIWVMAFNRDISSKLKDGLIENWVFILHKLQQYIVL